MIRTLVYGLLGGFVTVTMAAESPSADLAGRYLDRYFAVFPTRATAAGRHERDRELEQFDAAARRDWIAFNRDVADRAARLLGELPPSSEDALDLELLLREARRQAFEFATLRRPERDPLFWTAIIGEATVFLLVREDLPRAERLSAAAARAAALPRLAREARDALAATPPSEIAPQHCRLAAGQAEASARFYREGFSLAAEPAERRLRKRLTRSGVEAAEALERLAGFLRELERRATGSPRLGEHYAEAFRLGTGVDQPSERVLARAEAALEAKRAEAAGFGRRVWSEVFGEQPPPADDAELLRRLFGRIGDDHAATVEAFVEEYRELIADSIEFVRREQVMALPEPLTLTVDRSPSFFIGQSVGGVYPAGPFAPQGDTLLFLPTPPDAASAEEREAFFRDFNHHFNVMITPHEIIPGHYLQLKFAALHPRKVRALFGDGVYIEGWGTFCERLMLDLGWGGSLDRLAHLKKQLENIARTIVDIRVHTRGMSRDEVLRFVQEQALQEQQFAENMWTRAITSAPQLTTYFLGYEEVMGLYEAVRARQGDDFDLRRFMDGMMELGPVPVRHYRNRMLQYRGQQP